MDYIRVCMVGLLLISACSAGRVRPRQHLHPKRHSDLHAAPADAAAAAAGDALARDINKILQAGTNDVNEDGRELCDEGMEPPPNRVNTTEQVADLRAAMLEHNPVFDAFLISFGDEHMSDGADWHQGVEFISGFTGSSGYVIVTAEEQALWTDGRYFLQADQQLDCNWSLMRQGNAGVPEGPQWLAELFQGEIRTVGITYSLTSLSTFQGYEEAFDGTQISKENDDTDLLSTVWTDRPDKLNNQIYVHELEYAGVTWQHKMANIRSSMLGAGADALILTGLDDTAWTFNLRGSNRHTSPLFDSYAIITAASVDLYVMAGHEIDPVLAAHLNYDIATDSCAEPTEICTKLKLYDNIAADVATLATTANLIWLSPDSSNYMIYDSASSNGEERVHQARSPVQLMKALKNDVELEQYRRCQIKDSKYVIEFAAFIEDKVQNTQEEWSELSGAEYLNGLRAADPEYRMLSFNPISGSGPNGAVIHYRPTVETDRRLTTDEMYLLDSGGNYLCGTTDITRTFHFGDPTDEEMEAYTRVLMGAIDLAVTVWPAGWWGSDLDVRTRSALWQHGWDYNHGTGHGIGMFINVHEGPGSISVGFNPAYEPLQPGMIFSDEPGFYLDGKFGVRLETEVEVVEAEIPEDQVFDNMKFLKFDVMTLVPFERHLVKEELLDVSHRVWLNAYHDKCVEVMRPMIADDPLALEWFDARVQHYPTQLA